MSQPPAAASVQAPAAPVRKFNVGPLFRERAGLLASFIALVIVNVAAGRSNRDTSNIYFTPITPSGITFSVWGLIFFLQAIAVVWAAIPYGYGADNGLKERIVSAVALPWPLTWLFQILWQFTFLARTKVGMWFGLLFLAAAFASMAWAVLRLKTRFTPVPRSWHGALSHAAFWVPSSVNAAWLSAATIVGALVVGVAHGAGETPLRWIGIALVALITLLAVAVAGWKPDIAWPATLVWALAGVFAAHRGDVAVAIASMVCLVVCALATAGASVLVFRGRQAAAAARAAAPASGAPAATGAV